MKCIEFDVSSRKLDLVEKLIPEINSDEVLVQVHFAGVCGTDLHIIDGEFPCKKEGKITLGHEFSGVVSKVGCKVKHVNIGDKVVVDPNKGCMVCNTCRNGNPHFCKTGGLNNTVGIFRDGGWQEYCAILGDQVVVISNNITLKQAALTEPISCISHGFDKLGTIPIGARILVMGAGIIGNLFVSLLKLRGHKHVTISEPNKRRLDLIQGKYQEYKFVHSGFLQEMLNTDPSYSFDYVIDCSGNVKALELGFTLLDFGGTLCIFGVAKPSAKISLSPYTIFKKELSIIGVTINPFSFPKALNYLQALGDIEYSELGIEVFRLSEYEDAIKKLRSGEIAKAAFKMC